MAPPSLQQYLQMPVEGTYALGAHALENQCRQEKNASHPSMVSGANRAYRPLTLKENIQAKVDDYHQEYNVDGSRKTEGQRLRLWNKWLESCTAVASKRESTKFKMILQSNELITIKKNYSHGFLNVRYDALSKCIELDGAAPDVLCNQDLTKQQVLGHPGYLAALDDDRPLLRAYIDIVYSLLQHEYGRSKGMAFVVRQNTLEDQLKTLSLQGLPNGSGVGGTCLNGVSFFLRMQ